MTQTRANVIWIFGDQHREQALGYRGDPNVHTPNIDRLAEEGLTLRGVSGFPLCCPYRGALISGRYPHHVIPGHQYPLPDDQPTIATVFKEAGYHTAYIGKWHMDGFQESNGRAAFHIVPPERRGDFDTWIGYENNNAQYDCWVHGGEGDNAFHYQLPGYETDALTDLFIEEIETRGKEPDQPFFAILSVQPPHNPYVSPEEWMGRHTPGDLAMRPNVPDVDRVQDTARRELSGYYGMIENLDWNVGRIREALTVNGLEKNTHVIFFSDHGDMHGSHGQFRKMTPHEESIRVPFIIGGIGSYEHQNGMRDVLVNHVDITVTTLGLCGIDIPDWMQGTDYSGHRLRGKVVENAPESAYLQSVIPTGHGDSVDRPWRGVLTTDGWKYVVLEGQPWLMFNLNEDPYEQVNLAFNSRFKAERERLQRLLTDWIERTGDSFDLPTLADGQ